MRIAVINNPRMYNTAKTIVMLIAAISQGLLVTEFILLPPQKPLNTKYKKVAAGWLRPFQYYLPGKKGQTIGITKMDTMKDTTTKPVPALT